MKVNDAAGNRFAPADVEATVSALFCAFALETIASVPRLGFYGQSWLSSRASRAPALATCWMTTGAAISW